MASSLQLPNAASEETPEKDSGQSSSRSTGSPPSVQRKLYLETLSEARKERKEKVIHSLRNAFLDGQKEVDPKWELVLAELTSLVASCSFNEEELKWKPLPPIDSNLSIEDKTVELKRRRYSGALTECLSDPEGVGKCKDWIGAVGDFLNWKDIGSNRKYYTYVLVDPRSHGPNGPEQTDFEAFIRGVFYIGKGCGSRCAAHFFKEESKEGKCKKCNETVDLQDDMKTIVHKCCKSPKFNSELLCTTCDHKKADQKESSSHWCCGSDEYPQMEFTDCPHCRKKTSVVDGMFSAHNFIGDDVCEGSKSQPTNVKCKVCNATVPHKDGKICEHNCIGSGQLPEKGVCIDCKGMNELYLVDNQKLGNFQGFFKKHYKIEKCKISGTAVKAAIKDEKMKSIWEAGGTPTVVGCTQGDGNDEALDKEAMMIIAYGTCNLSTEGRQDYKQGKLINKSCGDKTRLPTDKAAEVEGCGLNLLIQAWKNYQSNGKPRCAAQIKWPSNPKEVNSSAVPRSSQGGLC